MAIKILAKSQSVYILMSLFENVDYIIYIFKIFKYLYSIYFSFVLIANDHHGGIDYYQKGNGL